MFQVLKRHFSRYTPEMVARGLRHRPRDVPAGGGRARPATRAASAPAPSATPSAGPTTPSASQYIRAASILQMLLGNIGRPGGGILALRGHASIQGSTDIPTLFDMLPGYVPMPHAHREQDLAAFIAANTGDKGFWGNRDAYVVSLLKAWFGDAAQPDNDFCFDHLPRLTGDHSRFTTVMDQASGKVHGYFVIGENPAIGTANARMQRRASRSSSGSSSGTSTWSRRPRSGRTDRRSRPASSARRTSAPRCSSCPPPPTARRTAPSPTPNGCCSGTHKAVEPPGDCRSDLWFYYQLGARIRRRLAGSTDREDRPMQDLTWEYPIDGRRGEPSADAVLREINGTGPATRPLRLHRPEERRLDGVRLLDLLRRLRRRGQPVHAAQARQGAGPRRGGVGLGVAGEPAHALQPRLGRPRRRTVERAQRLIWWNADERTWTGGDVPDFAADQPPDYRPTRGRPGAEAIGGTSRSSCRPTARRWLYAPAGLARRPDARALRAAGVAGAQRALPRAAAEPGPPGVTP